MQEIEFFATLEKNGTITVPDNIGKGLRHGRVHVKLIDAEAKIFDRDEIYDRDRDRAWGYINYLLSNPIKVDKSVPFLTRDEIYDRRM